MAYKLTVKQGQKVWEQTIDGDSYGDEALFTVWKVLREEFGVSQSKIDLMGRFVFDKYEQPNGETNIRPGEQIWQTGPDGILFSIVRDGN